MKPPWTPAEVSASGQVFEFRLWAALMAQSRGQLHPFLPYSDRGIDALVHRLTDGAYIPVQAKGRTSLTDGEVHIVVWAASLADDEALLVSGLVTEDGLGPTMLVAPEGDFKRLADQTTANGRPIYSTGFGMHPRSDSRWLSYLVPTERLVERFGIAPEAPAAPAVEKAPPPPPAWRSDLGFLGEAELVRLLAEREDLNLFRPFPDLETSELAVLHLDTRAVIGFQIKTISVQAARPAATVSILASSFRPSPATWFTVFAWLREEGRFHDDCLLIPSTEMQSICEPGRSNRHLEFDWHPGSTQSARLRRFVQSRSGLKSAIA